MRPRLRKSDDRVLCGVCGGLAKHLEVDTVWVRAFWAIGILAGLPFFLLGYIVLAFVMPDERT